MFVEEFLKSGSFIAVPSGKILAAYGKSAWSSAPSDQAPSFYFPDFFLRIKNPWRTHCRWQEVDKTELYDSLSPKESACVSPLSWQELKKDLFREVFEDLQTRFLKGDLLKAVPFVFSFAQGAMDEQRKRRALCQALSYARAFPLYLYGFWEENRGIIGATPELLFERKEKTIKTVALGGTAKKGNERELTTKRLMYEQELIVQDIAQALNPLGATTIEDKKQVRLPLFTHWATQIECLLSSSLPFEEIVRVLHPTSAVGAYPRLPGGLWLKKQQKVVDRKRFGAPVGYRRDQEEICYVGIRNVQWDKERLAIAAGCGVTHKSRLDKEWSELELKLQSIKELFALS